MATYKDDLDIIKAAEKDSSKLSLNAITELDNKGLLGMYGGGSGGGESVSISGLRSVKGVYDSGPSGDIYHRTHFEITGLDGYSNYVEMIFYYYIDADAETSDRIDLIRITTDNDDETVILLFDKLMGSVPDKMPDYGQNLYRCWVEFDTDGTPLYPDTSLIAYMLANQVEIDFIL